MAYEPKPGIVSKIIDKIANYPKTSLIISLLLIFSLLPGLLQFREKYDVRIWFRDTDPLIKTLDSFEKHFGNDENLTIVLHSPSGIFDLESSRALIELTEKVWEIPQVIRVDSLANYNYSYADGDDIVVESFFPESPDELTEEMLAKKKKEAMAHQVIPGFVVSRDGNSAIIFARLAPTLNGSPNYKLIVQKARELISQYEGKSDHRFHLIGEAAVNDAFRETAAKDGAIILPILFALIFFYLFYVFRSLVAITYPIMVMLLSVAVTMGVCFYAGYGVNNILSILPAILIAISIADSVHILMTFFQFRGVGMEQREAAYKALHKNLIPTLLTTLTTMIGFFSLTMTELLPIRQLGLLAGVGAGLAWLITIFFMGPLLFLIHIKTPKLFTKLKGTEGKGTEFSYGVVDRLSKIKRPIIFSFLIFAAISIYLGSLIKVNSNPFEYFVEKHPLRIADRFIRESFGGASGPEIMIRAGKVDGIKDPAFLRKVEALKDWLDSRVYINKTLDIIDIVKEMNQNMHGGDKDFYVLPDSQKSIAELLFFYSMGLPQGMDLNNRMSLNYDTMRMSVLWNIWDTNGWLKHTELILQKAKSLGLDAEVTGKFYLFQRMMRYVVVTFFKSISMAMLFVALLMMIVFKSFKLGLISLIPNVIPILAGGAVLYFLDIPLNIGSSLVASVTLGIAVDDTIHFLTNYYHYQRHGVEERDALATIYSYTGSALVLTTVILASGFGLYAFGDFVPNIHFGILCAIVLSFALVVDLIFLPALLMQLTEMKNKKKNRNKTI